MLLFSPLLLSFSAVVFTFFHWLERTKANFFGLTWMFIQSSQRAICGTEANFAKTSGYFCSPLLFAKYQQPLWNIQKKSYPALFDRIWVRLSSFLFYFQVYSSSRILPCTSHHSWGWPKGSLLWFSALFVIFEQRSWIFPLINPGIIIHQRLQTHSFYPPNYENI